VVDARDRDLDGVVGDPELLAHRRYGALSGRLLLVRPDGYLACSAPLSRPDVVERYLEMLTGRRTLGGAFEIGFAGVAAA
jgi:hypothetical protein